MTDSAVSFTNIDEEYPIAGVDNDSQGFRDNFSTIKIALEQANVELTTLLTNSARLNIDNNFNGVTLKNAITVQLAEEVYNSGVINVPTQIDWENGNYQNVTVDTNVTLTLIGWPPDGKLGKMRIALRGTNTETRTITWALGTGGTIRTSPNWPTADRTITVNSATTPKFIDVWTSDAGGTVYMDYVGEFTSV